MTRTDDLEINENLGFQEREWAVERFGWAALFVIVVLGAVGLFGHGPVSWSSSSTEDGFLEVSYEKFGRRGGSQALTVRVSPEAARDGVWELDVAQSYVQSMQIESVQPTPASVDTVAGEVRYTFSQAEPGGELQATFVLTPSGLWSTSGDIGVAGGQSVTVSHFLFP